MSIRALLLLALISWSPALAADGTGDEGGPLHVDLSPGASHPVSVIATIDPATVSLDSCTGSVKLSLAICGTRSAVANYIRTRDGTLYMLRGVPEEAIIARV